MRIYKRLRHHSHICQRLYHISQTKQRIEETLSTIQKRYVITDEGTIEEYLGTLIEHNGNKIRISQPHLVKRIIASIPGMDRANPVNYPALQSVVFNKDEGGEPRKELWSYRSLIDMLNF